MLRRPAVLVRLITATAALFPGAAAIVACGDQDKSSQKSASPAAATRTETLKVGWFPAYAHNAGFFDAMAKGLYEAEKLRVQMVPLFGHDERIAALRAGRVDFALTHVPSVILDREEHPDVKVVAVLEQRSPLGTYSRVSDGIDDPKAYAGHTLASNPGSLEFKLVPVLARLNGFDPRRVKIKELDFSALLPALLTSRVDMITGFWASGAYAWEKAANQAGEPIRFVRWSDYGWTAYGDAIVTSENRLREDPDSVRRFVSASLRGFADLAANPDGVVALVRAQTKTERPDEIRVDWRRTAETLVSPGTEAHGLGWMDAATMRAQAKLVLEAYGRTGGRAVEDAYSNDHLPGAAVNVR
jgi:NitT/TauT family transport system substrate-binding protein